MATKQILSPTSLEVGTALGSMERPIVKQSSIGLRTIRVLHQNESFLSSILVSGVFRSGWHWCLEILKQKIWAYINKLTNVQESLEVFGIRHYPKITRLLEHPLLPAPSQSLVITCFLGLLKKTAPKLPSIWHPERMAQDSVGCCVSTQPSAKPRWLPRCFSKRIAPFKRGLIEDVSANFAPQIYHKFMQTGRFFSEFLKWRSLPMFNINWSQFI